jgi:dipeptidyl aminopeptidase/acylaminoacyl peptidase
MPSPRPVEPGDLYRLRIISDPQISPDGRLVAFVLAQMDEESNEYRRNVYVADADGVVTQYTSGDKDTAPRWSPDGNFVAFLSARKDRPQIYLLGTGGGEARPLTDRRLGAGTPVWSPDSRSIAFTGAVSTDGDEEDPKERAKDPKKVAKTKISDRAGYKSDGLGYIGNRRRHIFIVEVADGALRQLTEGDYRNDGPAWSPDGMHIAFASDRDPNWDISTQSHIFVVPREGGTPRQLTANASFTHPTFSPDGSRIAMTGRNAPDEAFVPDQLYSIARDGSDLREESAGWDGYVGYGLISDVVGADDPCLTWREDGIYVLGSLRGESDVYRSAGGSLEKVTEGRHAITGFSFASNGSVAYAKATSDTLPEIYRCGGGEDRRLTHENDDFLAEVFIQRPERLSYPGAKGENGDAWLLAPRGADTGKHPLIVYIHGGPMLAYGEVIFFEYQVLAGQGFGVFYPNIHGSATYGREYQTSINGAWGGLDFQDVVNGTELAGQRPWVDRSRIGIIGGSYGGFMTNWAVSHDTRFKAAVTERCVCDWISFFGTSDGGWVWNRVTGAYPEDDVQKLWDMSPVKYVRDISTPLLVMHYEGDDRTPIGQGEEMFNALRRNGKETRFIVFPEESHGMTRTGKPSRRVERLGYILDWFKEKL